MEKDSKIMNIVFDPGVAIRYFQKKIKKTHLVIYYENEDRYN